MMPLLLIVIGLFLLGYVKLAAWVALIGGAIGYLTVIVAAE